MGKKSGAAAPVDFKGQEGCLTIQVKNAAKLPNRDLLGESDPFVELELDGESIFYIFCSTHGLQLLLMYYVVFWTVLVGIIFVQ